jgi:hypothetical protein
MKKDKSNKTNDARNRFLKFVKEHKPTHKLPKDFRRKWSGYEMKKVQNAISIHRSTILEIPGVNGISYGPNIIDEETWGELEIAIHVEPNMYEKVKSHPEIPTKLDSYLVRIYPTKFQLASCPNMDNTRYAEITPGVNIGPFSNCGSLGVYVWYKSQSYESSLVNRFFLSAWHVVTNLGTLSQAPIFQPGGAGYKQDVIGFVWDAPPPESVKGAFDVGMVKLDYPNPDYARFESPGHQIFEHPYLPFANQTLYLVGAGQKKSMVFKLYLP